MRIVIKEVKEQVIHYEIIEVANKRKLHELFMYGSNNYVDKRNLWEDIIRYKRHTINLPWIV